MDNFQDREDGWCVPYAFFCARVWSVKRKAKVRIAVFKIDENTNHFQAQYFNTTTDTWEYLTDVHEHGVSYVIPYGKNIPDAPEPFKYMTLTEAEAEQQFLLME
jgi:hypothetical protein